MNRVNVMVRAAAGGTMLKGEIVVYVLLGLNAEAGTDARSAGACLNCVKCINILT